MCAVFPSLPGRVMAGCSLILAGVTVTTQTARAGQSPASESPLTVTNVLQLRTLDSRRPNLCYFVRLEGNVLWANPAQGRFVLQDASGAEELEMDLHSQSAQSGRRVRLEGNGMIARRGGGFRIGVKGAVVDNNGVHGMVEKSGTVFLKAGRQPIRLDWFNGVEKYELEVEYEGPGLPRQRIPDAALFRIEPATTSGSSNLVHGLDYQCYEVAGEVLPDFSQLTAVKTGTVANFDLSAKTRDESVALQFTGYLEVPRDGAYTFYTKSDDGSRLFVGEPSLRLEIIEQAGLPSPHLIAIGQTLREEEDDFWAEVEGKVTLVREQAENFEMELSAGAGHIRVEVGDAADLSSTLLLNQRVRVTGFCQSASTTEGQKIPGILLVPSRSEIELLKEPFHRDLAGSVNTNESALPVLTTAVEVHRLKREEAQRAYPVKLRGVITSILPEHQAFTIQDSTRGLYVVDLSTSGSGPPQIGEYLEVEGTTDPSLFAPIVNAQRVSSLGAGHLPQPVRPTWDQLINGSLDAQYVEIQGIVTAVHLNGVSLLTREGTINVELRVTGAKPEELKGHENALVRVRGCLFASWDYVTHQVKVGEIRIYGADVTVDQPAPADLFSTSRKTVAELLLFDPQASVLQRVKVSGQIVYVREAECFMMDGSNGLRFITRKPAELKIGDVVEVVGFPELSGAYPVLREAVARKTGQAALPQAKKIPPDDLVRADYDSILVRVEGLLVGVRKSQTGQVLEMQNGVRTFVARLSDADQSVLSLPVGSRLEVAGVYAAQGGNRAAGQDIASFELLLNFPSDIKVLARPPWWTLERLLIIVGALACVLAFTVLWITQLHRQVEQRTVELETQIQERQRVEHQRAMEQERARVAQDLHDELGSGLTEISMLAARSRSATAPDGKRSRHLEQVSDKARNMVTALDEIVWAMNPRHDSFASLVSYFCLYADRFLGLANIAWRLDDSSGAPDHAVDSRHRHQLFLAFKEALTNVVRHSGATEVRLAIRLEEGQVRMSITDNGRGLPVGARTEEMDGVANMRSRIEKMGGQFEIRSEAGRVTIVRFYVPSS